MTMLDLRHADSNDDASAGGVARALAALTPAELLRLKRLAQLRARLVPGLDWEDLLNDALLGACGTDPGIPRRHHAQPCRCPRPRAAAARRAQPRRRRLRQRRHAGRADS